jgi:Glycogen recognition site of AMP-activated protein kinase
MTAPPREPRPGADADASGPAGLDEGTPDAALQRELAALRQIDPPPALAARVMTGLGAATAPTLWQWLRRPIRIEVALSPLAAVLLGATVVVGGAVVALRAQPPTPVPLPVATVLPAPLTTVTVRFTFRAPGARKVAVAGSFNGWSQDALLLDEPSGDGLFVGSAPLPPGLHEYMFVVDGRWVTDPDSPLRQPDGFGRQNSLLRI